MLQSKSNSLQIYKRKHTHTHANSSQLCDGRDVLIAWNVSDNHNKLQNKFYCGFEIINSLTKHLFELSIQPMLAINKEAVAISWMFLVWTQLVASNAIICVWGPFNTENFSICVWASVSVWMLVFCIYNNAPLTLFVYQIIC